uniref:Protein RRNAD1 n=1 Tax=Rhizophora mucronata TaxID=61149 RepID=A0A2P2IWA4_RHIMU
MVKSPSIGRQGKALRRKQLRKNLEISLNHEEGKCSLLPQKVFNLNMPLPAQPGVPNEASGSVLGIDDLSHRMSCNGSTRCEGIASVDKYSLFKKFCESGFSRLALKPLEEIHFRETWKEAEPFAEFIGPYWSLRAALGPLLETLLLLDRLLFLQEQDDQLETVMLPIFDPVLSPRNVAIIAKRR